MCDDWTWFDQNWINFRDSSDSSKFYRILGFFRIFQNIFQISSEIFQNIFRYFPGLFQEFFRIFSRIFPGFLKDFSEYFSNFLRDSSKTFSDIFQDFPKNISKFSFSRICPGYFRIFQDCSGFTRIYSDILQTFVKQVIFFSFFDIELETKRQGMKWIALNQWELIVIWERDANEKDAHGSRPYFSAATASCLIRFSN